jgi:hypothetical protein
VPPAHRFGGLETEQHIGGAGRDLRRQHFRAKAQVRRDDAAALRHAGDLGLLDVMAERDRRFGEDLGGGHHALATGADDENVGGVELACSDIATEPFPACYGAAQALHFS